MDLNREDRKVRQDLEQAWALFAAGQWDSALREFQSVLLSEPDSAIANSVAGACLLRLGHLKEAEHYTRIGVQLAPGVAIAHIFLAEALSANEEYAEAESEYWEAIAVNPEAPAPRIALGRLLLAQERNGEARTIIGKAIETSPEDPDGHYLMAICNSRDEATEEALKDIDLAIKFAPDSDVAWHFRGLLLMGSAKSLKKKKRETVAVFRDVAESLRKAVELNSNNHEAREHLRLVYNAIAAIDQYLDSVGELKRNWWQILLCVAGLVIFAIVDRSFWINALIIVAAVSALAIWRNRRTIAGLGPDPFESIHPLELKTGVFGAELIALAAFEPANEWLN